MSHMSMFSWKELFSSNIYFTDNDLSSIAIEKSLLLLDTGMKPFYNRVQYATDEDIKDNNIFLWNAPTFQDNTMYGEIHVGNNEKRTIKTCNVDFFLAKCLCPSYSEWFDRILTVNGDHVIHLSKITNTDDRFSILSEHCF